MTSTTKPEQQTERPPLVTFEIHIRFPRLRQPRSSARISK